MRTSTEVDAWFEQTKHPLKDVMQRLRPAVIAADDRVDECVKWKTPTFTYKGNIASINPQAKQFVSLMFHHGAKIPGDFPSLQGGGEVTRYMRVANQEELARMKTSSRLPYGPGAT